MIVVRVSRDHRPAIVGSPGYLKSHPKPTSPHDLLSHRCINFRHGSAGVYRRELDKGDQSLTVAVNGPLILDEVEIMIRAAIDGVGLAFLLEEHAAPQPREWVTRARAESLVPAVPRLLALLPEPAAAARRAFGAHRDTSLVAVSM
jgi:DNA-binding transcriptional LysR family regulator